LWILGVQQRCAKGFPQRGDPKLRGYETLFAPHHWHRNCATFSASKRSFRDISNQDISAPLQFHTRTNDWSASPKTTGTRSRVQHRHFPTRSCNLPRYPDLDVATTMVDRTNFCKPIGSKQLCWQKHVRHETKTTTHTVYTLLRADSCNRYCACGGDGLPKNGLRKNSSERVDRPDGDPRQVRGKNSSERVDRPDDNPRQVRGKNSSERVDRPDGNPRQVRSGHDSVRRSTC
jgi:hypothetical protein